ncbi:MAG TPA: terminase family protein [Salinarimonas sp.]|nr:terminase family protein [Salinarimonas sp.]
MTPAAAHRALHPPGSRGGALAALRALQGLRQRAQVRPLDQVRWTPPQFALIRSRHPFNLLRTGNQFGKTWSGCAEVIWRCLGQHPYKPVRSGPIEAWVICKSWSQSIAIQAKLWALLPKDQIAADTKFNRKTGFAGVQKAVEFRNGSVLRIKTIGQDTLDLESATLQYVWIDEPLGDAETFSALQMRLRRTGGHMTITMTPATSGDLTWLRELVDASPPKVRDLHFRMEPQNFIPEGATVPLRTEPTPENPQGELMDAGWIEREIEKTLPHQRGVRCHGEWEYATVGKVFDSFDRNKHVRDLRDRNGTLRPELLPRAKLETNVGIDYGEEALRTCGVEVYADTSGAYPRLVVVGEYAPTEGTTVDMDVDGLLAMLAANGDTWRNVDHAWADKRYEGRTTRKNAREYERVICRRLALAGELRPSIRVAKKGLGRDHKWPSVRWLHEAMIRPGHFIVDASCVWLIEALEKWEGGDSEIYKDILDALRYACRHLWGPRPGAPGRVLRRRV